MRKLTKSDKCSKPSRKLQRNTTLKGDRFTYRVTWSEEDSEYVGLCAEFPSLSWLASAPEEALQGIRRVVADVVADMKTKGRKQSESLSER